MQYPMLTKQVMEQMYVRETQFERLIGRVLSSQEHNAFVDAYKASRADVFMELNVRKEAVIPETEVVVKGFEAPLDNMGLNTSIKYTDGLKSERITVRA